MRCERRLLMAGLLFVVLIGALVNDVSAQGRELEPGELTALCGVIDQNGPAAEFWEDPLYWADALTFQLAFRLKAEKDRITWCFKDEGGAHTSLSEPGKVWLGWDVWKPLSIQNFPVEAQGIACDPLTAWSILINEATHLRQQDAGLVDCKRVAAERLAGSTAPGVEEEAAAADFERIWKVWKEMESTVTQARAIVARATTTNDTDELATVMERQVDRWMTNEVRRLVRSLQMQSTAEPTLGPLRDEASACWSASKSMANEIGDIVDGLRSL